MTIKAAKLSRTERVYSIRSATTREQTTPLLLHLLLLYSVVTSTSTNFRTQCFPPGSIIARFVILPQFYFTSDNLSVSCHRLLFSEIRLPFPFCLQRTGLDISPVIAFGSENGRKNECTQTSTVCFSLQGCRDFMLGSYTVLYITVLGCILTVSTIQKVSTLRSKRNLHLSRCI